MHRSLKMTAIAVFAATLGMGAASSKAEQVITAGGWTITSPNGIALVSDGIIGNTLYLEKEADFADPVGGLIINFQQTSTSATPLIEIQGESVVNSTGETWSGFDFKILPALGSAAFTDTLFAPPSGQAGGSFTTVNPGSLSVNYAGGSQPSGPIPLFWGGEVGPTSGALIISADPSANLATPSVFGFKELPISVPLPAAALQGLAGLGAMGLFGLIRKRIRGNVA